VRLRNLERNVKISSDLFTQKIEANVKVIKT